MERIRIGILGASGYTGAELLRLLRYHSRTEIRALTADRQAGKPIARGFSASGAARGCPIWLRSAMSTGPSLDLVFCGLPHGTTQEVIAGLPDHLKIVDLSADFRLADTATYAEWYGHEHRAPELQREAVYGLTEIAREAVAPRAARRQPRLLPDRRAAAAGAADPRRADRRRRHHHRRQIRGQRRRPRGARGQPLTARSPRASTPMASPATATHRRSSRVSRAPPVATIVVNFTPHLMPMNRGILETIYVRLDGGATLRDLRAVLEEAYAAEPFVHVLPDGSLPATRHVRGTNLCLIGVSRDRVAGRAIVVSAIDNLVKGASGQAIQNMNAMLGLPETTALEHRALFP